MTLPDREDITSRADIERLVDGFYERVRGAFAVVQTGERQGWANFIFKKGVIAEALRA